MSKIDSAAWTGRTWTMRIRFNPSRSWSRFGERPRFWSTLFLGIQRVRRDAQEGEWLPTWGLLVGHDLASDVRGIKLYWGDRSIWLCAETHMSLMERV